jgi:hypothetical protein
MNHLVQAATIQPLYTHAIKRDFTLLWQIKSFGLKQPLYALKSTTIVCMVIMVSALDWCNPSPGRSVGIFGGWVKSMQQMSLKNFTFLYGDILVWILRMRSKLPNSWKFALNVPEMARAT